MATHSDTVMKTNFYENHPSFTGSQCAYTGNRIIPHIIFGSGVGVTKAPFVNFSVSKIFDCAKVTVRFDVSHSYLTGVTAAELRRHLSNINVLFNS